MATALLLGVAGVAGCTESSTSLGSVYIKKQPITSAAGGSLTVSEADCATDSAYCPYVGTSVLVPRNALSVDTEITLSVGKAAEGRDGSLIGPALDFGPDGTTFASPVQIIMPTGRAVTKDLLRVYVTQADGTKSVLMPYQLAYDASAQRVRFLVDHFTTFQCGEANDDCSDVPCPDGTCNDGQCNQPCDPSECGPAPGAPSWNCENGEPGGFTGLCERQNDGTCAWDVNLCPEACTPDECGPAPGDPSNPDGNGAPIDPNQVCPDGTIGGTVCSRRADGSCGWETVECNCPAGTNCEPPSCSANDLCPDGSVCDPNTGTCTWVGCGANGANCPPGSTCDPATGQCVDSCVCPDGTACSFDAPGQAYCNCDPSDPNCNPVGCGAGTTCPPGSVCDPASNTCVDECVCPDGQACVIDPNGSLSCENSTCDPTNCGPQPGIPNWTCADGSVGGPTGQCILVAGDGTCGWEINWCEQACDANDCGGAGAPLPDPNPNTCPDGTVPPYVCGYDAAGICSWQQQACEP